MKKFSVEFTEKNLTGNAGLTHLGKFAKKIGIGKMIEARVSIKRAPNADYSVADAIIILMMGVLAGAKRMSHLAILEGDTVLRTLFDWTIFPVASTFGRIFKLFNQKHCQELSEVESYARQKVWSKKWFGRITLDMDSTVKGVTGHQEGAAKGFNSKKKGQRSYHPLLCFIAETRECFHNWFRTGSAYTGNGAAEFMKECFSRLPKRVWKVFVRADSGFFIGELIDYLEEKSSQYLIKVKMKNLGKLLMAQSWRKAKNKPGIETTEFWYKCSGWKKARRFVAIRQKISEASDTLFPLPQYEFFCYVTNLDLTPWEVHKCYGKRSTSENWIEWCKNQMASGSILTQDFWANSAIFQVCILAYNLLVWMMLLHSKKCLGEEPDTIRFWLIQVPGRLIRTSRRWKLKLSEHYIFQREWRSLEDFMERLEFA